MNVMAVPLLPARPVRPTLTEQSDHIQKKDSGHGYIRRPLSLPSPTGAHSPRDGSGRRS
jgi:hypothetical protein